MRTTKTLLTIFALLSLSISALAQNSYSISGIVKDEVNQPLTGATISLRTPSDSALTGTIVDIDGHFVLNDVLSGPYRIVVSFIGYDDYSKEVNVLTGDVNLGIIKLGSNNSTRLQEVKIVEKVSPVKQNEDTTQFNAGSYKVNPDASAEDLVRKMPGMDLSTGKPQAQGEAVGKVLVDGKPFFGDDASSSLKNLPAEVIDKIQVYDEKSDQSQFSGFDDGNTTKTINIITKPGKRQGIFGRLYAGGGSDGTKNSEGNYDSKYNAGGSINYFAGNRRIGLIGQTNDVNIQNFSAQDLIGVSGTSGGRGGGPRGGGGGGNSTFATGSQGGINKTNAIGFNYSDKWGKKIDVTASYFFNNTKNNSIDSTQKNFVLPEQAGQNYNEATVYQSNNFNHRFNLRLNYTIDSSNSLLFVPSLNFQNNSSSSYLQGATTNGSDVLNSTVNNYSAKTNGYNLSSLLLFRHKFKKQGRTLSLSANGGLTGTDGNSTLNALIYAPVNGFDTTDQIATNNRNGWNINSNINYTEPLSKKSFLQIQYGLGYQESDADKRTYNFETATNQYSDLDSALSNKFGTHYLTNRGGLTYRFMDKNYNFNIGVDAQNANLDNNRILPYGSSLEKSFNNILPNARFQYNFSKKKTLRLFYRTSTNAPSVDQLQNVINNVNPLQLTSGNPNLVQSYDHRLFVRYNATSNNGNNFFAMLSGQLTQDYIGNNTLIVKDSTTIEGVKVQPNAQYIRPENMSGYYNLRSFATYGLPINLLKSNININGSASYVRTPGIINDAKNYANNTTLGFGLVFSSNISEKIDFTLSSNSNYSIVRNTLNATSNTEFLNQTSRLVINYIFWKGIVINTELNHQYYNGLSAGFNQNYLLWNAGIAKKIFKNQQGEIRASVYDLLKQNKSITPTITDSYIQYTKSAVLQRYFMLTFTYNLRFFKGGASMKDAENSGRQRGDFHGGPDGGGPPPGGPGGFAPGGGPGGPQMMGDFPH